MTLTVWELTCCQSVTTPILRHETRWGFLLNDFTGEKLFIYGCMRKLYTGDPKNAGRSLLFEVRNVRESNLCILQTIFEESDFSIKEII